MIVLEVMQAYGAENCGSIIPSNCTSNKFGGFLSFLGNRIEE